jgi:eukaryotic-like serine/threonine-protein kinase
MPGERTPSDLDTHWKRLGLDAIEPTLGAADTVRADGLALTWLAGPSALRSAAELPRLTLSPPALAAASPLEASDLVPLSVLGEGGMGRVLVAHEAALDRDVAVKVLKEGQSKGALGLVAEARITGALEHPNVIPVYALGSSEAGLPAVVMKRVDGVSWQALLSDAAHPGWERLLRNGTDRVEANVRLLMQVCDALAFAHLRGVVHRDLKPSNVLLGELGEVYLADWGVAMRQRPADAPEERPQLVGTPAYMAPEMAAGDVRRVDARTDVFLLGATLTEVLTGRPPYLTSEVKASLKLALECAAPAFPPEAPVELAQACRRAMAADPADRFPTALDFRRALADFLAHRGSANLAAAARERLEELKAAADEGDPAAAGGRTTAARSAWALFAEARFGFTQALESWPENQAARAGLAEAIATMAQRELARSNLAAARALVAELSAVPPELAQALDALAARLEAEQQRRGRLEKLEHELDLSVAADPRRRFVFWLAIATAVTSVVTVSMRAVSMDKGFEQGLLVVSAGTMAALFGVGFWLQRRELLVNAINRRLTGFIMLTVMGFVLHRVLGWIQRSSVAETIAGDTILAAAMAAFAALTVHRRLAWAAGGMVVSAVPAAVYPQYAPTFFGAGLAFGLVLTAILLRTNADPEAPPADASRRR